LKAQRSNVCRKFDPEEALFVFAVKHQLKPSRERCAALFAVNGATTPPLAPKSPSRAPPTTSPNTGNPPNTAVIPSRAPAFARGAAMIVEGKPSAAATPNRREFLVLASMSDYRFAMAVEVALFNTRRGASSERQAAASCSVLTACCSLRVLRVTSAARLFRETVKQRLKPSRKRCPAEFAVRAATTPPVAPTSLPPNTGRLASSSPKTVRTAAGSISQFDNFAV
jgi:hypothetical protein